MPLKITDLNASKPIGSGAGGEGVESADNYLRLIQQVILDTMGTFLNPDGSPKFPVGYQDQRAAVLPSPENWAQFLNATRGVLQARLPAAGLTYAVGNYKTDANPATTAVLTGSLTKWSTNLLPGMKFVGWGGGVYTIKSIESETSMTLTSVPAAGDSWDADFTKTYSVRMLYDALQWLDMFPIFAVTRPDGSAGILHPNGEFRMPFLAATPTIPMGQMMFYRSDKGMLFVRNAANSADLAASHTLLTILSCQGTQKGPPSAIIRPFLEVSTGSETLTYTTRVYLADLLNTIRFSARCNFAGGTRTLTIVVDGQTSPVTSIPDGVNNVEGSFSISASGARPKWATATIAITTAASGGTVDTLTLTQDL